MNKLHPYTAPTVLLVDDAPENLAVLRDAFEESGFTVLTAHNGAAALIKARATPPDLILLDAFMPGLDGFAVCRQLRMQAALRLVPVIFMTALTDPGHVAAVFEAGGTDYISKPVRQSQVLARANALLGSGRDGSQSRHAMDAFGNAVIAVTPADGRIVWQSPQARHWMQHYLLRASDSAPTPPLLADWLRAAAAGPVAPLTMLRGASRLTISIATRTEQWLLVLREESHDTRQRALMALFGLAQSDADVLHWLTQGKSNQDIAVALGVPPATLQLSLERVFATLQVGSRSAATALAIRRLRAAQESIAPRAAA